MRFFDGAQWTAHVRDDPPPAPSPAARTPPRPHSTGRSHESRWRAWHVAVGIALGVVIGLVIGSSGKGGGHKPPSPTKVSQSSPPTTITARIGATVRITGGTVTLLSFGPAGPHGSTVLKPAPAGSLLEVAVVRVCAVSAAVTSDPLFFNVSLTDGRAFYPALGAVGGQLELTDLSVGSCTTGNVAFDLLSGSPAKVLVLTNLELASVAEWTL
jgi:hypothetical protein